jgi:NitT/TauT family transport system permease protein
LVEKVGSRAGDEARPLAEELGTPAQGPSRRRVNRRRLGWHKWSVRAVSLVVFVGAWQLVSDYIDNPVVFPSLQATLKALRRMLGTRTFYTVLGDSASVLFEGLFLAIVAGIAIGVIMGLWRTAQYALDPYVNVLNAMPRVALIPLIIVWFGLGGTARVVVVFLLAVLAIIVNTYTGLRQVDDEYRELARSYCANRWQELRDIALPSSIPYIMSGIRLAVGHAVSGVVTAELLISYAGLGGLLIQNSNLQATSNVYALALVFAALGVVLAELARLAEVAVTRGRRL